jgi:hypothetical protein
MTKAEKAVLEAAMRWFRLARRGADHKSYQNFCRAEEKLDKACAALAKARKK